MPPSVCYQVFALLASNAGLVMPDVETRPRPKIEELPGFVFLAGDLGNHHLELIEERVLFDPVTGAASATVSVTLTAGTGGFSALLMLIDEGMVFDRVYDDAGDVPYDEQAQGGYRYVQASLQPAVPAGEQVTLHFVYGGTLLCPSDGRFSSCDFGGGRMDFVFAGTLFPIFYDPFDFDSTPYYERRLSISIPSGSDVYVTADEVGRDDDGVELTVDWRIPVRQDFAAYVAVFGDLVVRDVPGTSVPTRVLHLRSDPEWIDDIVGWAADIVAYLDQQAGRPFPFPQLTLVKLPSTALFPGTAGHATSLLAEYYGDPGARYFEETFAHETSHIWWGVLAVEQATTTRFLTEGMATFTQIDYTGAVIMGVSADDRDRYLGRRYNEMELISRYSTPFGSLPPVVPPPTSPGPGVSYTEWAYLKSATTLELLRVSIGDVAFAVGLADYAGDCTSVPCTTDDFEASMSAAAGQDLSWFFDQYVFANTEPTVTIGFTQDQITVSQTGATKNQLELWLELADGTVQKERLTVETEATIDVTTPSPILRVRPNPRFEPLFTFLTGNDLDVDFDSELDGADLIRCAFLVGEEAIRADVGEGVFTGNLDFDARCDLTNNALIDANDLDQLRARYPEVR